MYARWKRRRSHSSQEAAVFKKQVEAKWNSGKSLAKFAATALTIAAVYGLLSTFIFEEAKKAHNRIDTETEELTSLKAEVANVKLESLEIKEKEIKESIDSLQTRVLITRAFGDLDSLSYATVLSLKDTPKEQLLPELVDIPAGEFMMGSPGGIGENNEHPLHRVKIDAFQMGKYEITVKQFARFMVDSCYTEFLHAMKDSVRTEVRDIDRQLDNMDHPIVNVSWYHASSYAEWAGMRLATEAEWEYAARGEHTGLDGTEHYMYPWGDSTDHNKANYYGVDSTTTDIYGRTAPFGKFPATGYGLHDMAGNAWEWCSDWYLGNYYSEFC